MNEIMEEKELLILLDNVEDAIKGSTGYSIELIRSLTLEEIRELLHEKTFTELGE